MTAHTDAECAHILERVAAIEPVLIDIDRFSRVQNHLSMGTCYPDSTDGKCCCGCGKNLRGRRTRWATDECSNVAYWARGVRAGHSSAIRFLLSFRDKGLCAECGKIDRSSRWGPWEADHILAVLEGGGGCGLENFQTLCTGCHNSKTAEMRKRIAATNRAHRNRAQVALWI